MWGGAGYAGGTLSSAFPAPVYAASVQLQAQQRSVLARSPRAAVMHDLPGARPARTGTPAPRSPPGTHVPTWGEASAAHPSAQVGGAGCGGLGSAPRSPSPLKAAEGRVWTLLGIRVVGSVTPAQQDILVSLVPSCGPDYGQRLQLLLKCTLRRLLKTHRSGLCPEDPPGTRAQGAPARRVP